MNLKQILPRKRGIVLVLTLILVLFVGLLSASLFTVQFYRNQLKTLFVNKVDALYSARSALNYSAELVWNGFLASNGGATSKLSAFQAYLDQNKVLAVPPLRWVNVPLTQLSLNPEATAVVDVYRTDGSDFTELRFRAALSISDQTENLESVFRAECSTFNGFNFALFSNNISCTFCHAKIDSVHKYDGGPYERVRVAALESLMVRSTSADSTIAGTLYTMGKILESKGTVLPDLAGTTVDGYSFKNNLIDPATTALVDLKAAPVGADGTPLPGYNLYKDYSKDPAKQADGAVPTDFPSVFPDENANRKVDDVEFQKSASTASGTASGFGYVVPQGSVFTGSLSTSNPLSISGAVQGNLVLVGTPANPIRLDGTIVVNGDVVIQGVVQGTGSIVARNNVYVTGDLVYNDKVVGGKRTFGVAADGTANGLGIAAGGNILVGDYLTPKGGSVTSPTSVMTGTTAGGYGFVLSELSLFNRREWQKTQPTLPGAGAKMVKNSTFIPGYLPKYYALADGNPVYNFLAKSYWDDAMQTWIGPEHAGNFTDLTTVAPTPGAVVTLLNPTSPWLTPAQLKQFWIADEAKRALGSPLKLDGLIYTDSSVFTLARGASKTSGQMVVNGALVARDTGILAPGSLQLNYDQRVTSFLGIKDTTNAVFHRVLEVRRDPSLASN